MHEQNEIGADRQIQFLFGCQTASLAHLINFHINITFRGMYVDISRRRQKERERERERERLYFNTKVSKNNYLDAHFCSFSIVTICSRSLLISWL